MINGNIRRMCLSVVLLLTCATCGGCSRQKTVDLEVMDGCLIRARGIAASTAKQIIERWQIQGCRIEIENDLTDQ